MFEYLNFYYQK